MTAETGDQYASYSAPRRDGEKLLEPGWGSIRQWLDDRFLRDSPASAVEIGGVPLSVIGSSARKNLLNLARQYTASYRDLPHLNGNANSPIVMGGHQPDLFHCGVWYKNFVLSELGTTLGAVPIHFIVDNDLCRSTGIQVPHIQNGQFFNRQIPFDDSDALIPWENRHLRNTATWRSFPQHVLQACAKLQDTPLVHRLWQHASRLNTSIQLGCLLSQARHLLESELGLQTLEIPLSQMVSTSEFAQFGWHLLTHLARFRETYNAQLDRYRLAHRIRNHAQPLPNLAADGEWLEAPFWCYTTDSLSRDALWVQHHAGRVILSDRKGWQLDMSANSAVDQWMQLHVQGICIRPRALITTMYARLILSDLFVHGIGGGKYDQITDRLINQFWGVPPAPYVVASATMRLKLDDLPSELGQGLDQHTLKTEQDINAFQANPELLLHADIPHLPEAQRVELKAVADRKQQLLQSIPSKGEKWEWHLAMKQVKQQLSELARPHLEQLRLQANKFQFRAQQQALLSSREYSFCLFSLADIRSRLPSRPTTSLLPEH